MTKPVLLALDRAPRKVARMTFALDKSARRIDADGRLHVATTNISKATVNEYWGEEIPGFEELGLAPDKMYRLLRAPEELEKAAPTFSNIPLLREHVQVSAADHRPELVVGSTGTDTVFEAPYLKSSLVVWDQSAIDAIESRTQHELSCAYRYKPDMKPGVYEGLAYDGVMREIVGNHVALVEEGRAGPDVVVADSVSKMEHAMKPSRIEIAVRAALGGYLRPRLAQDASVSDIAPLVRGVTRESLTEQSKAKIVAEICKAYAGKLAQDEEIDPEEMEEVMETVSEADDLDEEEQVADAEGESALLAKVIEYLGDKLSDEDKAALQKLAAPAEDEEEAMQNAREMMGAEDDFDGLVKKLEEKGYSHEYATKIAGKVAKEKGDDAAPDEEGKKAMDKQIETAARQAEDKAIRRMRAIQTAEKEVKPIIGDVDTTAMDSAAEVYKMALDHAGIDLTDVPESAYRAMVRMIPQDKPKTTHYAQDASAFGDFQKHFPDAVIPRSI